MFCTKCGANIAPGVKFCTKCGAPMGAAAKAGPPPAKRPEPPKAVRPVSAKPRPKIGLILVIVGVVILIVAGLLF